MEIRTKFKCPLPTVIMRLGYLIMSRVCIQRVWSVRRVQVLRQL